MSGYAIYAYKCVAASLPIPAYVVIRDSDIYHYIITMVYFWKFQTVTISNNHTSQGQLQFVKNPTILIPMINLTILLSG